MDVGAEAGPEAGHFESAVGARGSEGVVLAGMSETGFDPFGLNEPGAFEAAKQRVDSALGYNETGAVFEAAQHLQPIKAAGPKCGEGGKFHAAFAELYFPFVGRILIHLHWVRSAVAYSQ